VAAIGNAELEIFVFVCVALGLVWCCWAVAGLHGIYDQIGSGYLDVSTSDPVAPLDPDAPADELTDAEELLAATAALRQARGKSVPSVDERLAAIERDLREAA
jgi:hypothetical protein